MLENVGCKPWSQTAPPPVQQLSVTSCCWKEVFPQPLCPSPSCRNQRTGWLIFHCTWPSPPFLGLHLGLPDSCRKSGDRLQASEGPSVFRSPTACPALAPPWLVKHPSLKCSEEGVSMEPPSQQTLMSCWHPGHALWAACNESPCPLSLGSRLDSLDVCVLK